MNVSRRVAVTAGASSCNRLASTSSTGSRLVAIAPANLNSSNASLTTRHLYIPTRGFCSSRDNDNSMSPTPAKCMTTDYARTGWVTTPMGEGDVQESKTHISSMTQEMIESGDIVIAAYNQLGFRLHKFGFLYGPVALFPRTPLSWRITHPAEINPASLEYFTLLDPKLDVLIIGVGDRRNVDPVRRQILPFLREKRLNVEILPTCDACGTYNLISAEHRYCAAALYPPDDITFPKRHRAWQPTIVGGHKIGPKLLRGSILEPTLDPRKKGTDRFFEDGGSMQMLHGGKPRDDKPRLSDSLTEDFGRDEMKFMESDRRRMPRNVFGFIEAKEKREWTAETILFDPADGKGQLQEVTRSEAKHTDESSSKQSKGDATKDDIVAEALPPRPPTSNNDGNMDENGKYSEKSPKSSQSESPKKLESESSSWSSKQGAERPMKVTTQEPWSFGGGAKTPSPSKSKTVDDSTNPKKNKK